MNPTIARVKLEPTESQRLSTEIAENAQRVLSYTAKQIPIIGDLAKAMMKLDIQPLDLNQVRDYKASKEGRDLSNKQKAFIGYIVAWAAFLTSLFAMGLGKWLIHHELWAWVVGMAWTLGNVFYFFWCANADFTQRVRAWITVPISQYRGYVPEFALSKALQIKTLVPMAGVNIEWLAEETRRRRTALNDPFMVITNGLERYYIDVWNEPEIESKLT